MRAVVIDYDRRGLRERDIAEPVLRGPEDVLFRISEVGVCGTDRELAVFRFGYGPPGDSFLVPGHEALGEVVQADPATGFRPGDMVVPTVRRACHPPCASCRRGRRDLCLSGGFTERGIFGAHGYFTELAVDRAEDLVRVPHGAASTAVLIEPASVVEKAVETAFRLHAGEPAAALVIGAGTIGLLAAAVLRLRGLAADLVSLEPPDSPRARLAERTGARYLNAPDRRYDIVIEAAGTPSAASVGLTALGPLGVLIVLGAAESKDPLPLVDLIVGNQVVAGSVNASPAAFAQAAEDLPRMPPDLISTLIERRDFSDFRSAFVSDSPAAPKIVHSIV
jgi:threonine dehydrogenase-like Zn-dependent dehydrogenase